MNGTRAIALRTAAASDVAAMYALIATNAAAGHLLPRELEEVRAHASRFVVAMRGSQVVGCAELAPVSPRLAEVRSLAVDAGARHQRLGTRIVGELRRRAAAAGFRELCVMTHAPEYFAALGFAAVPHRRVQEKVVNDCVRCPKYRVCGQFAMVVPLAARLRRHDDGARSPLTIALQVA